VPLQAELVKASIVKPGLRTDLIIDVGMHDGTDTAYYLAKGFTVVAIEANPLLVAAAEENFSHEIAHGRLKIIGAAITETYGTTAMAIADDMTVWSSVDPAFITRNQATKYRYAVVRTLPFVDVLAEHGVPYFLKIDIEGMDMLPVRALHQVDERPLYVSVESNVTVNDAPFEKVFDEIAEMWSLGYRAFKYVNQTRLGRLRLPAEPLEGRYANSTFAGASSGPFGRETPGRWLTAQQALSWAQVLRLKHNIGGYGGKWSRSTAGVACRAARKALLRGGQSWYDLHARLGY
jgi:FkbM family methyltransferase